MANNCQCVEHWVEWLGPEQAASIPVCVDSRLHPTVLGLQINYKWLEPLKTHIAISNYKGPQSSAVGEGLIIDLLYSIPRFNS